MNAHCTVTVFFPLLHALCQYFRRFYIWVTLGLKRVKEIRNRPFPFLLFSANSLHLIYLFYLCLIFFIFIYFLYLFFLFRVKYLRLRRWDFFFRYDVVVGSVLGICFHFCIWKSVIFFCLVVYLLENLLLFC